MRIKSSLFVAATLALGLTQATGAFAQAASTTPADRQARVEERIRDMYATLHVTEAQDAEWNAFAQVMLDNAQAIDAALKQYGGDRDKLSAPEILENYAALSARHAQNAARMSSALSMLYANFTPDQKKLADEMFRKRPPAPSAAATH